MKHTLKHTLKNVMPLRIKVCNRVTIATKRTRPVFVDRENPDTPPAITEYVREFASLMRNANDLTAHLNSYEPHTEAHLIATHNDTYLYLKRIGTLLKHEDRRPLWVCTAAPVKGKEHGRIYTVYSNTRLEDKPTFRHDSLYLFDLLSEDYNA